MPIKHSAKLFALILIFIAILPYSNSYGSDNITDLDIFYLNGKVKKYTIKAYTPEYKSNKWEAGQLSYTEEMLFNKNGNMLEKHFSTSLNNEAYITITKSKIDNDRVVKQYIYDSENKLTGITEINYISSNQIEYNFFDENGNKTSQTRQTFKDKKLIKEERLEKDESLNTTLFSYDDKGLLDTTTYKNNMGSSKEKIKFMVFDDKNNWTESAIFVEDKEDPLVIMTAEIEYYPD